MGVAGVGFPEPEYMIVAKKLYAANNKIICPSSNGGACHSTTPCAQLLPSIEHLTLQIHFEKDKNFEMPIAASMRQTDETCKILVHNLGQNTQSKNIVLGSSFLQQFVMQYERLDGKSTVKFQTQKSALFGSTSGGDLSDGAIGLAIVFGFIVLGLIVAAISYVCFKVIKRRSPAPIDLIDDPENKGSLLDLEDSNHQNLFSPPLGS